ncbi:MAG: di-trans,poly-cis-decaprenylcistransferase, partial [Alphaproteobacteria bacterium]|nr:di-trans,poly-cis-decaprenylcistransferase [Alphaproteobacteria bacterium]
MDGNGRWAKAKGLPRVAGHKKGAESVRAIIKNCTAANVPYLTLYAFSAENWRRPEGEVNELMGLLRFYIKQELKELHANGVRLRFIGDIERLQSDIRDSLREAEALTKSNTTLNLQIALSYGSRQELAHAV